MISYKELKPKSSIIQKSVSFIIGSFLIILLNFFLVPWIEPKSMTEALFIGFSWASLMTLYDIFVGRVLFKLSWERVLEDFNIFKGSLLSFGILLIIYLPPLLCIFRMAVIFN